MNSGSSIAVSKIVYILDFDRRASLVVQRERICLPIPEKQVPCLIQEDPLWHRATKPVHDSYCACAPEPGSHNYRVREPQLLKPGSPRARALQQEKPPPWEAGVPQLESSGHSPQLESQHAPVKTPCRQKSINQSNCKRKENLTDIATRIKASPWGTNSVQGLQLLLNWCGHVTHLHPWGVSSSVTLGQSFKEQVCPQQVPFLLCWLDMGDSKGPVCAGAMKRWGPGSLSHHVEEESHPLTRNSLPG